MRTYWYVVDANPVPWRVGPVGAARNGTTGRFRGYVGQDQELKIYQEAVRAELLNASPTKLTGDITVTMYFWRNQAEYSTDKRAKGAKNQVADGTNMYKATEDACQKILFDNDRANVAGHFYVMEQGPEVKGKVIIAVSALSPTHHADVVMQIPDEVYLQAFGSPEERLALGIDKPNTQLQADDEKYASADVEF